MLERLRLSEGCEGKMPSMPSSSVKQPQSFLGFKMMLFLCLHIFNMSNIYLPYKIAIFDYNFYKIAILHIANPVIPSYLITCKILF